MGFPRYRPGTRKYLYREHALRDDRPDSGCWHFSGHQDGEPPDGRFDLTAPAGTCYLAESELAAASQRCGRFLAAGMPIPAAQYEGRMITKLPVAGIGIGVADATASEAGKRFQVTRELFAGTDYDLTARWAEALNAAGFTGIAYEPRFSVGAGRALGLFDTAGPHPDRPVLSGRRLLDVLQAHGFRGDQVPSASQARPDDEVDVADVVKL